MTVGVEILELIQIDKSSHVPVYRQLVACLNCIIHSEQFSTGQSLPRIRDVAVALGINPNTVVRAYDALEESGAITKRRGSGCFIASAPKRNKTTLRAVLGEEMDALIAHAGSLGVSPDELADWIRSRSNKPARTGPKPVPKPDLGTPSKPEPEPVPDSIWQPDDAFID